MRYIFSCVCFFSIFIGSVFAQPAVSQTNDYNSNSNPHYWKNRKPFPSYWQQDVHYVIDAKIDDQEELIEGVESLYYDNNSPDTLYEVYFHLYQNAFTPNSYAHQLRTAGKIPTTFGEHELKGEGTRINSFSIDNELVPYTIDNTILKAKLNSPLLPGQRIRFQISFTTFWDKQDGGNMRRRMKTFQHSGITHFDGVHWYPRICVYDRKFGWTTDQHLGKEFYGDFGQFEVNLEFPNQYIVEATGDLLNESEVLPKELREAIDLKNYKTSRSEVTTPIIADGTRKVWRYKAINVHDFAFTADPTYRMGVVYVDGVKCVALAQEQNAHKWQETAKFVAELISTYSSDFGQYIYPKMVAADARDGMEYPMLTLNSGNWPNHQYVIAHEVGHNWFFGMLGNNETYRSSLDEGFTQFLTAWSLKKINNKDYYTNPYDKQVVFNRYLEHATGTNNATLNIHADHYNSAERHGGGYSQVYFKTASMLYNLQYVLGDELFLSAMKNYVDEWKICHPYWEDFRNSIIRYTKADLNWFFDQWITTTKTIDYAVKSVSFHGDHSDISIKRKGGMQMPLDIEVIFTDGSTEQHYIPNTYFNKKTTAIIQPTWIGWDQINEEYSFKTENSLKVKEVIIDPSERLADINRLNNHLKIPSSTKFSNYRALYGNFDKLEQRWHPLIWYNSVDGLKIGAELMGNYGNYKHLYKLGLWYNSKLLTDNTSKNARIHYTANYDSRFKNNLSFHIDSRFLDGLNFNEIGLSKVLNKSDIYINFKSLYRNSQNELEYLIYADQWNPSMWNNSINLGINRQYSTMKGRGNINIESRSASLFSDYNYSYLKAELINTQRINKLSLRSRLFAQLSSGDMAPESQLQLAGANNEELMDNALLRSTGFIPKSWEGHQAQIGHIHYGGGLNLRGFAGYSATNNTETDTFYVFAGNSGSSVNLELDFNQLLNPFKGKVARTLRLNTYLFTDAGILFVNDKHSDLRLDAGLGTALSIRFNKYNYFKPLVIRFDMPLFLNRIPAGETDYFKFRYVIGVSRAF